MRVMKATVDEVVDVIAVWHRFMAAAGTVAVALTADLRGANDRVALTHLENVSVDVVALGMEQTPVMQIVDMVVVTHGRVPAARAMLVGDARMRGADHVGLLLSIRDCTLSENKLQRTVVPLQQGSVGQGEVAEPWAPRRSGRRPMSAS